MIQIIVLYNITISIHINLYQFLLKQLFHKFEDLNLKIYRDILCTYISIYIQYIIYIYIYTYNGICNIKYSDPEICSFCNGNFLDFFHLIEPRYFFSIFFYSISNVFWRFIHYFNDIHFLYYDI